MKVDHEEHGEKMCVFFVQEQHKRVMETTASNAFFVFKNDRGGSWRERHTYSVLVLFKS